MPPQAYNITDFYYYSKVNFSKPIVKETVKENVGRKLPAETKSQPKNVIF